MTDEQSFLDDLMLDARGASVGLWEVVGLARTAFPERSAAQQLETARAVVRTLLDRGWVAVRVGPRHERWQPRETLEPAAVSARLSDDRNWSYDSILDAELRYFIEATERGERELREDLRRRGLWADSERRAP